MDSVLVATIVVALAGGLMRGATGFGAAMIMTPLFALLIGAKAAVPVALLLETFAAATMLPAAMRIARWPVIAPLGIAAVLAIPAGSLLLVLADAATLRRLIAATVVVFSLVLLSGWRFRGEHRASRSIGFGVVSGAMLGATGIGGPPVILYLLSGPDPAPVTRANLTLYIVLISAAGLVVLALAGLLDGATVRIAVTLTIPFALGVVAGSRLFSRFSTPRFRQMTIVFVLLVSLGVLLT